MSKLITKNVKRIGIQLQEKGVIETVGRPDKKNKNIKSNELPLQPSSITSATNIQHQEKIELVNKKRVSIEEFSTNAKEKKSEKKRGKKLQTIYEYLKEYTRKEIDVMLSKLTEEDMTLVKLRYGEDLDNPVTSSTWSKEESTKFYGNLIPKMKRLLSNSEEKRKKHTKVIQNISDTNNQSNILSPEKAKAEELPQSELISQKVEDLKTISSQTTLKVEKDDYLKILELIRTPSFGVKIINNKRSSNNLLKIRVYRWKIFHNRIHSRFFRNRNK